MTFTADATATTVSGRPASTCIVSWTDSAEWDAFVAAASDGTVAHRWAWLRIVQDTYGHPTYPLAAVRAGRLVGVLPLVLVRSRIYGRRLVSMPYLDCGGICAAGNAEAEQKLFQAAVELATEMRVSLELRHRSARPYPLPVGTHKVSMILDLDVRLPELLHPFTDAHARLSGRVRVQGLADDPVAVGDLHIAPLARRRVRYRMDFTALDGRRLHLDGWKSVSLARPLRSMTTLPVTITDQDGAVVAEALLRFDLRGRLWPMLRSLRVLRETAPSDAARELRPRWSGERGRLEVWYTTLTDPRTGTGVWIHHELVAPHDGAAPYLHGWAAVFPPGGPPHLARFGPEEWRPGAGEDGVLQAASASLTTSRLDGRAGDIEWELAVTPGSGCVLIPIS